MQPTADTERLSTREQSFQEELQLMEDDWAQGGPYDIGVMDMDLLSTADSRQEGSVTSQATTSAIVNETLPFYEERMRDNDDTATQEQIGNAATSSSSVHESVATTSRNGQHEEDDGSEHREDTERRSTTEEIVVDDRIVTFKESGVSKTVQQARTELLSRYTTASDDSRVDLLLLDGNISPSPGEGDPANLWTEDLVGRYKRILRVNYPGLKSSLSIVTNKISRFRREEMIPRVFCIICWQKYARGCHPVSVCRAGARIRRALLHYHLHQTVLPESDV